MIPIYTRLKFTIIFKDKMPVDASRMSAESSDLLIFFKDKMPF